MKLPSKFEILIRKNLKTEYRSWKITLIEFILLIIIYIVFVINPTAHETIDDGNNDLKFFSTKDIDKGLEDFEENTKKSLSKLQLFYAPLSDFTTNVMDEVSTILGLGNIRGFQNEDDMESFFDKETVFACVNFHKASGPEIPDTLHVEIRFPAQFRTIKAPSVEENLWIMRCSSIIPDDEDSLDIYLREGFLSLQHTIFGTWRRMIDDTFVDPKIQVGSFRYGGPDTCTGMITSNLNGLLQWFAFFVPFLHLIWRFAREMEENIFAHHWKYGYQYATNLWAHFLITMLHFLLLDLIIIFLVMIPFSSNPSYGTFRNINVLLVVTFLIIYNVTLILCAYIFAIILKKAKNAILFGAVIWISTYALFSIVLSYTRNLDSLSMKFSIILFFNDSYSYGMNNMANYGQMGDGDKFYWTLILLLCLNALLSFILLSVALYYCRGLYIEGLPLDFCGIPGLCRKRKAIVKKRVLDAFTMTERAPNWEYFENSPVFAEELLRLKNVCYIETSTHRNIIKNVTMRFFKGEITVLLGSHSSGKTTLISLMAGWKRPNIGFVEYNGRELWENLSELQYLSDVNMPNNPLFDLLTIKETFWHFINIKRRGRVFESTERGQEKLDIYMREETNRWLDVLGPSMPNRNTLVKYLTFDQKRLLCLCCALCCDTSIILLDEPTLHMHAAEQFLYWKILTKTKADRTIVVTTISIDEADQIADRIGILEDGILRASGTPLFLKTKFGVGISMIITKQPYQSTETITNYINGYLPNTSPPNVMGNELNYKFSAENAPKFQLLLINLEKSKTELGIIDIRMLSSELGEVYMHLCTQETNQILPDSTQQLKVVYLKRYDLLRQHFRAMFYKKILHQMPNIVPIIMMLLSLFLLIFISNFSQQLDPPSIMHNGIVLGLDTTSDLDEIFLKYAECRIVEITSIEVERTPFAKTISHKRIFNENSFYCGNEKYKDYITNLDSIENHYGGVETVNDKELVLWINKLQFHSAPVVLNLVHNILLTQSLQPTKKYSAIIENDPMPMPLHFKVNLLENELSHLRLSLVLGVVMPIIISCFILQLVEERITHVWLLQKMAGINMAAYWISTFLWDVMTYLFYCVILVIIMSITSIDGFSFMDKLYVLILLVIFGVAILPYIYIISLYIHVSVAQSFFIAIILQLLFGVFLTIFEWDVYFVPYAMYVASLSPIYALLDGVSTIYVKSKEEEFCNTKCDRLTLCDKSDKCNVLPNCCLESVLSWEDGIIVPIIYMLVSSFIGFVAMTIIGICRQEDRHFTKQKLKNYRSATYPYDDRKVVAVKKEIASADLNILRAKRFAVDQLEYTLPKRSRTLDTVSFAVERQTCLAIYGTRHSSKTHLIKQLIGENPYKFGSLYVYGHEYKYNHGECWKIMGYCPQDHGLFNTFTPREFLYILCMIRGIPETLITGLLDTIWSCLDMRRFINKKCSTLPVDFKRKVNIAASLIAYNKVLILDEPTRGLPPTAKREIWNLLRFRCLSGNAIIVTTSESIECEALAELVLIYDTGEMWGIGSYHEIRARFTRGFYIEVRLRLDGNTIEEVGENFRLDIENLHRFMSFLHGEAELCGRADNCLKFYLPVNPVLYSYLWGALEKNKRLLNIVEYHVSQGTMIDAMRRLGETRVHRMK